MTLAQARGRLASGQLEGSSRHRGRNSPPLQAGGSSNQMQEAQMESAQSQAAGSTDVKRHPVCGYGQDDSGRENFSMPAGMTDGGWN